jgi:hypothetical protein
MTQKEKYIFNVGDRVAVSLNHNGDLSTKFVYDGNHGLEYGEVISVLPKNKLLILWEAAYLNHSNYSTKTGKYTYEPKIMNSNGILPAKDAEEQFSVLEKEFKKIEKEIKDKLENAAKLIIEADKLASKATDGTLSDMYDAISPLYDAMDKCGWNTSSFSC